MCGPLSSDSGQFGGRRDNRHLPYLSYLPYRRPRGQPRPLSTRSWWCVLFIQKLGVLQFLHGPIAPLAARQQGWTEPCSGYPPMMMPTVLFYLSPFSFAACSGTLGGHVLAPMMPKLMAGSSAPRTLSALVLSWPSTAAIALGCGSRAASTPTLTALRPFTCWKNLGSWYYAPADLPGVPFAR